MRIKVCGMKYNTTEVAALQPDYLGFIFYDKSPRNFNGEIPALPQHIKKVGVFVDAPIQTVLSLATQYDLDVIQLHGDESPHYCAVLKSELFTTVERYRDAQPNQGSYGLTETAIWKVFSIKDSFDFKNLASYEICVDAFLFDTKGENKGGNGVTFNWNILKKYPSKKPFVLSGGIGLEEIEVIEEIAQTKLPILAIDVNSKFETKPGLKKIAQLKQFQKKLNEVSSKLLNS